MEKLKAKALQILRQEGIADLLAAVYVDTMGYHFFEGKDFNIDRSDIDIADMYVEESFVLLPSYGRYPVSLLCGQVSNRKFKIGGVYFTKTGKEASSAYQRVLFFIGEKLHIDVIYNLPDDSGHCFAASDYNLIDVEEFHRADDTILILKRLREVVDKEQKLTQERWEKKNGDKLKQGPRFSF